MLSEIANTLTSHYYGEFKKIMEIKQDFINDFHQIIVSNIQMDLLPQQRIQSFVNLIFNRFPKQDHSAEKRHKLMLLFNTLPDVLAYNLKNSYKKLSHNIVSLKLKEFQALIPNLTADNLHHQFMLYLSKKPLFMIKTDLENKAKPALTLQQKQKLDLLLKNVKTIIDNEKIR